MTNIASNVQWGSTPTITASFDYEMRRSGTDMEYRLKITIDSLNSELTPFGYPIYSQITLAGAMVDTHTLKAASPSTWPQEIEYTTEWFTVHNKIVGTTALIIRLYSEPDASRDKTYSYSLAVIPAESSVYAADGIIGRALTISISRYSTSYKHTIEYSFEGATGTIATMTDAASLSWIPALALCNQIPNDTFGICTFTCKTYSGETLIGSKVYAVRLYVPESVKPSVSAGWATVSPYNNGTPVQGMAAYVQGYSRVQVSFDYHNIDMNGAYGATIADYKVVIGATELTESPYISDIIGHSTSIPVTCYVYDSRGRIASEIFNISIEPYIVPILTDINCFRCDADGNADESGTYISLKAAAFVGSVAGLNAGTLRARAKIKGGSYGSYYTLTSGATTIIGGGSIAADKTHIVEFSLTDTVGNTDICTVEIPPADVAFNLKDGGKGAAFGKYAVTDNMLEIADEWQIKTKEIIFSGDGWNSLGLSANVSAANTDIRKGKGCYYRVVNENHVYIAFNCAIAYSGSAITVNDTLIPADHRPDYDVYALCATQGKYIARVLVNSSGQIQVEWVQSLITGSETASATVNWIDGYIDYWL